MFALPILLGGIGQGIGLVGSLFGASRAQQTADMNFRVEKANAESQRAATQSGLLIEGLSNQLQLNTAESNFLLAQSDAAARQRNADNMRLYAEAKTQQGREAMRRQRASFERFKSQQAAAVGASGVTSSGSVLDVMAETVGQMTLALQDSATQIGFDRESIMDQAALEEFQGRQQLAFANIGMQGASRTYQIQQAANAVGLSSANVGYSSAMAGAAINRDMGYQSATQMRLGAIGGIFAGVGQIAQQTNQSKYYGIR